MKMPFNISLLPFYDAIGISFTDFLGWQIKQDWEMPSLKTEVFSRVNQQE